MSLDRTKALETAQKFLAKGQYDRAIAEYQKIVREDPQDVRTWLKIGDLYTRKGARREATDTYSRVAEQYAQQGFFLKAVAVYKQILKLEPTRLDVSLRLAEMYEQLALVSDALTTYEQAAAMYARQGDVDRALSTLERMVRIDPDNIPVRIKYAEALSKANKITEAAEAFEAGAKLLKEQGRLDDFMKVAERLLYHRPGDFDVARDVAALYLDRNDAKRALAKLQLCFKNDPRDVRTLELLAQAFNLLDQTAKTISVYKELSRIHQEMGRTEERARILKKILELDPDDADARQALASVPPPPSAAVQAPPPSAVIRAPSDSRAGARPPPPRPAPIEPPPRMPPIQPHATAPYESTQRDGLFDSRSQRPIANPRSAPSSIPPEPVSDDDVEMVSDDDDDIVVVDEVDSMEVEVPAAPALISSRPVSSIPPEIAREMQIARLLTECDVFMRYGLKAKVIEQLKRVLDIDPRHIEARERLKDLYLEAGQTTQATAQLVALADAFLNDQQRQHVAGVYLRQALELDPDNEGVKERLELLQAAEEEVAAAEAEGGEDAVLFVDDEERAITTDTDVPVSPPHAAETVVAPTPGHAPLGTQPGVPMGTSPGSSPGARRPGKIPSLVPLGPASTSREPLGLEMEDLPAIRPEDFPREARDAARAPVLQPPSVLSPARISLRSGAVGTVDVEDILDEVDFFVAQGLYDEARGTLQEILAAHPGHPLAVDKLEEVADLVSQAPAPVAAGGSVSAAQPAPPPPPTPIELEDESFLLAEKLAEELGPTDENTEAGSDVLDVEQVFAQFKKGVEQQIGLEDSETHFDLGIAYKEMGLVDDAIHEFELSMSNPQRECIAHTMIGLCHIEKGNISEAISHFKKGLYSESKTEREELGLYFELGVAYELLHDPKEALYYFQKVQKRDSGFRNVAERIRALTQPRPTQTQTSTVSAVDDIDRAFDDLMGEGDKF